MSRAKKSPGSRKARKNRSRAKQPSALDFARNSWTPRIAAAWADMPERTLYQLLKDGAVPCLPMGKSQVQNWPAAHDKKRRRRCFRYVIPRGAFIKWWENIGRPEKGNTDKSAAA